MKTKHIFTIALTLCAFNAVPAAAQADVDWLQRDTVSVNEFGTQESWRDASATSTAKSDKLRKSFTQNVLNSLYGEIAGLTVMSGSGEPGSDNPSLNARGYNTFDTSNRDVLILIDGYESTLDNLSVHEIETITLLKDAAATAIYGMRGANGVLLVTTKRGMDMPLQVNFSAQAGVNTPFRMPKFLGSVDYATLYNEARVNDGLAPYYSEDVISAYADQTDKYLYPDVDWQRQILNPVSVNQNYNLNFRGGNKIVKYFALVNISDNNGFFAQTDPKRQLSANTKFTRYNVRGNIDVNITKGLSAHLNLAANIADKFNPSASAWTMYDRLTKITPNAFPVYNPDGSFGGNATFSNPVGDLTETGYASDNSRNIQSDLSVAYEFSGAAQGLKLSADFSFRNWFSGDYNKSKKYPYYSIAEAEGEYVYNGYSEKTDMSISDGGASQWRSMSYQFKLDYDHTFDKHSLGVNAHFFSDQTFTNPDTSVKDYQFPYKYMGVRGRLSYGFDRRYVAEFTYNVMGSDLYARGHKWGFFPAGAVAWVASNEDFLKDSEAVTFLKFRASSGLVGNATVVGSKRYAYTQDYKYTASYYLGPNNTAQSAMMEDSVADFDRTWERELKTNVGVELTLWNKLNLNADYFINKRDHILTSPTGEIPSVLGMSFAYLNLGKATNQGFELGASFSDKTESGFEYWVRANAWYAKNRIDYMAEELRLYEYQNRTGKPFGQGFGLVALGLFKDQADIDNSPEQTFGTVKPGDIKYKDMNEDGYIDSEDVTAIGYTGNPEFSGSLTLGFRVAGFDFETMFYGVANRIAYLSGSTYQAFQNQYAAPASALLRWTPETADTAFYPRLSASAVPNNTQYSSFWQVNGSFLKMRYLEVGYTIPQNLTRNIKVDTIRIFLNGTNLFSIHGLKKYVNADPEGLSGFPQMRTFSLGVNVQF